MSYRNLEIWKLSRGLVVDIHKMSLARLPKFEMFEANHRTGPTENSKHPVSRIQHPALSNQRTSNQP